MSVQSNGTFDSSFGLLYKHEIVMQNGDVGGYNSQAKDQNKFEVGAEVDYEWITKNPKFPQIKPVYAQPNSSGGSGPAKSFGKSDDVQNKIVRQSMLKASVDFHAINPELKPSEVDVLKTAERFVSFVNGNSEVQLSDEWNKEEKIQVKKVENLQSNTANNDMPF